MKKHLFIPFLSLFLLMTMTVACVPNNQEIEQPTLNLSTNSLQFDKSMGEQTIQISTNQPKWIAASPAENDWLSLEQQGSNLVVKVQPNQKGNARSSYITIIAGGTAEKVSITQSAADVVLGIDPQELIFQAKGGKQTVEVTSNASDWTADLETPADWIQIQKKTETVSIIASDNTGKTERRATLVITANGKKNILSIVQKPIERLIMPIMVLPQSVEDMIRAELKRGSLMLRYFLMSQSRAIIDIAPNSEIERHIEYNFNPAMSAFNEITVNISDGSVVKSGELQKFFEDNKFSVDKQAKIWKGKREDGLVKYEATIGIDYVQIVFTPIIEQKEACPTFKNLPIYMTEYMTAENVKPSSIEQWEKSHGSVLKGRDMNPNNQNEIDKEYWMPDQSLENAPLRRLLFYFITDPEYPNTAKYIGSLYEVRQFFTNTKLAYWSAYGQYKLTKEFTELMTRNGYEYVGESRGREFFQNKATNLVLYTEVVKVEGWNENKPLLVLNYYKQMSNSDVSSILNHKSR